MAHMVKEFKKFAIIIIAIAAETSPNFVGNFTDYPENAENDLKKIAKCLDKS